MSVPPFPVTKDTRRVLRVLLNQDDGELSGLRIARETRGHWRPALPAESVQDILMALNYHGWATSHWQGLDPKQEAAFPGRWTPRKRCYSLHPDYRERARQIVRSRRDHH